jgi:RNA polymerase sigma-70 factor (ECF subfamily)
MCGAFCQADFGIPAGFAEIAGWGKRNDCRECACVPDCQSASTIARASIKGNFMGITKDETPEQRLSRIATLWTVVRQAHDPAAGAAGSAVRELMERYQGAVYAYLLGALRDREAAEELFQEFALRVVRGDFHRADPDRGRFRDYLRRVLINLVNDYHRARQAWPKLLHPDAPAPAAMPDDAEPDFLAAWRTELLERTWRALAEAQPTYHAVLLFRVQNPDAQSPVIAEQLSKQLEKPLTSDTVRKSLQRGQKKFADLLVEEVRRSLTAPTDEELMKELHELDLLRYCQGALERRSQG